MCTLSWCFSSSGYQLVFNRDEQKSRALAQLPQFVDFGAGSRALMPIDPQGNGSWIAVNNWGLTLALLNFYQGRIPTGKLLSRGQIVRQAAALASSDQVEEFLRSLELNRYPPFSLVVFDKNQAAAKCMQWSGERLSLTAAVSPYVSSSIEYVNVRRQRMAQYRASINPSLGFETLLQFHASHDPKAGLFSVCMHREDAHTVSQTQVIVGDTATMNYLPGAPCTMRAGDMRRYTLPLA
ncbi:MAG: NRDE family protein [Cellvibrionaceae bacterium]|nr:NRDE family protein [Cellvibrionaceae bacterium]